MTFHAIVYCAFFKATQKQHKNIAEGKKAIALVSFANIILNKTRTMRR